jgi:hypothetical protein
LIEDELLDSIAEVRRKYSPRVLAFSIGATSQYKYFDSYYRTPVRGDSDFLLTGVVVRDVSTAIRAARSLDGRVDALFVDCEKKIEASHYGPNDAGNLDKAVRAIVHQTPILTYKGNDVTVDAIESLLVNEVADLTGRRVAVIGAGNIGAKAGLRLLERGNSITLYARSADKVARIALGLNEIKSKGTLSVCRVSEGLVEALRGADIVLATATSVGIIDRHILRMSGLEDRIESCVLVDVGKGCFSEDVLTLPRVTVFRLDVGHEQLSHFRLRYDMLRWVGNGPTRGMHGSGWKLVRVGVAGSKGEAIVDNVVQPQVVYGVCNGVGGIDWNATNEARLTILPFGAASASC